MIKALGEIDPHLKVNYYLAKEARTHHGVKTIYSINGVGKIGQITCKKKERKKETSPPSYAIHKNKFKTD